MLNHSVDPLSFNNDLGSLPRRLIDETGTVTLLSIYSLIAGMWVDVLTKKSLVDAVSKKIAVPLSVWIGFLYVFMFSLVSVHYSTENFDAISAYNYFVVISIVLVLLGFMVRFLDCNQH